MAKRKQHTEAVAEKLNETEANPTPDSPVNGETDNHNQAREQESEKVAETTAVQAETSSEPEQIVEAEAEAAETELEPDVVEVQEEDSDLAEQLELARQEAANNLAGWQRAAAEMANFKRRQEEQFKLQRDRIKGEVLEGVISALDDMDLAFQNVPEEIDGQLVGWVEGFRLVQRKLNKVLEDQNVMPISTEGKFDPTVHEAVSHELSDDHEEGQIIGELRKGYQVGNRVLRPALVRVAQ